MTTAAMPTTHIPAGAVEVDHWAPSEDGDLVRGFAGGEWGNESLNVNIQGQQAVTGRVLSRVIKLTSGGWAFSIRDYFGRPVPVELDADDARELANHLLAAAAELDETHDNTKLPPQDRFWGAVLFSGTVYRGRVESR